MGSGQLGRHTLSLGRKKILGMHEILMNLMIQSKSIL